jgi:murein DD-endopeptidase MepM/ murein hydrolase activator NlpD
MAIGDPSPAWPLPHDAKPRAIRESRRFGASRVDRKTGRPRFHAAIDLGSAHGHPVVAPESGTVASLQTFRGPDHALLLQTDTGPVLLLGEMDPASWRVAEGDRVQKGQWVGNVGTTNHLHFGAFAKGTRVTSQWFVGEPPPPSLLDPTLYVEAMIRGAEVQPVSPTPPARRAPVPSPSQGDGAEGVLLLLVIVAVAWGWQS